MLAAGCDQPATPSLSQMTERTACEAPAASGIEVEDGFEAVEVLAGGPLQHISGVAIHPDGRVIVADLGDVGTNGDESIVAIDPVTGAHEVLASGLPLGAPGRMVVEHRAAPLSDRLIIADWNTEESSHCCDGRILELDLDTLDPPTVRSLGLTTYAHGDPFGLTLGHDGDLTVMDFQGASAQYPSMYKLRGATADPFASSGNVWTTDRLPRHTEYGSGAGFDGYYVTDGVSPPTIWRVDDGGLISVFAQGGIMGYPTTARFGRGDAFGSDMYVLDSATKQLYTYDATGSSTLFGIGFDETTQFSDMAFAPGCGTLYVGMGDRVVAVRPQGNDCTPS